MHPRAEGGRDGREGPLHHSAERRQAAHRHVQEGDAPVSQILQGVNSIDQLKFQ